MKSKYEIQKELLIKNLEGEALEGYLDNLIKEIYESYLSNDKDNAKSKINWLNGLINVLIKKYPYINYYINYRCLIISNKLFEKIFDRNFSLYYPSDKISIDDKPEGVELLSDFVDDGSDLMIMLDYGLQFEDEFNHVINFIKDLPDLKNYFKDELTMNNRVPRKCIALITDFMNDVKEGKYDGYLEVPEDYVIDDEDYLDRFEYCENRHREAKKNLQENKL